MKATKILIVEHDPQDVELIERELKKGNIHYVAEVVETAPAYKSALRKFEPDIILSDYTLPAFSGSAAFKIKEEMSPDTPFIFVSGTIGEENSIALIRNGATDFALKDKLFTLAVKVERALEEANEKGEKLKAEQKVIQSVKQLARAQHVAHVGSWELDFTTRMVHFSDEAYRIAGLDPEIQTKYSFKDCLAILHPEDVEFVTKLVIDSYSCSSNVSFDHRIVRKDGSVRHIHSESKFECDSAGTPIGLHGIAQDVTERVKAEEEKMNAYKEKETVLNRINDSVVSVDNEWRYTFLNDAALATHPLGKKETIGRIIWDVHPEMEGTVFWDKYHEAMQTRKVVEVESYYAPMNIWFSVKVYPSGNGLTIFYTDITQRKKAEDILRESETRLVEAQSVAKVGSWETDLKTMKVVWSAETYRIFELEPENFLSSHPAFLAFVHPDDRAKVDAAFMKPLRKESLTSLEHRIVTPDGRVKFVEERWRVYYNEQSQALRAVGTCQDITERKAGEEKLKQNEAKLNEAQTMAHVGSWEIDMTTYIHSWSDEFYRLFGFDKEKTIPSGHLFSSLAHPDDADFVLVKMQEAFSTLTDSSFGFRFIRQDGTLGYGYSEYRFEFDTVGKPLRLYGIVQDITARKLAMEELQETHRKLEFHLENTPLGFIQWDRDLRVKSWSKRSEEIFGWTGEEFIAKQKTGYSQVYKEDMSWVSKIAEQLLSGGVGRNSVQNRNYTKDGKVIWCEWFNSALKDKNGKVETILTLVQDITERKRAESKIMELNETLQIANHQQSNILNTLPANIALLNNEGKIIAISEAWVQFAEDNHMQGSTQGVGDNYLAVCEKATGTDEQYGKEMAAGLRKILKGTLKEFALEYPCDSPNEKRWFRVEVRPLTEKKKSGAVVMHVNITGRKKVEQEIIELNETLENKVKERTAQLQQINCDLESFGYSVSHDLRSPLQVINGYSSILLKRHSGALNADAQELLEGIRSYTRKMSLIMESLLNLSRIGMATVIKSSCSMTDMAKASVAELKFGKQNAKEEINVHPLPDMECNVELVKQLWVNLISNAIKYSGQKEKPVIEIGFKETDGEIVYYVKDNGSGFDMKYAEKLFSPFQRLHSSSEYEGTGIGLTIVHRIITKHGGRIWAEGKVGKGATFYFTLSPKKPEQRIAA